LKGRSFFKIITKNQLPFLFENFLEDHTDSVRPLSTQYQEKQKQAKELMFIHSQENIVEKNLGEEEKVIIKKECLIGFNESLKIEECK
jgi:hypothetical protein